MLLARGRVARVASRTRVTGGFAMSLLECCAACEALRDGLSPRERECMDVSERVALGVMDENSPDDWALLLARLAERRAEILAERI